MLWKAWSLVAVEEMKAILKRITRASRKQAKLVENKNLSIYLLSSFTFSVKNIETLFSSYVSCLYFLEDILMDIILGKILCKNYLIFSLFPSGKINLILVNHWKYFWNFFKNIQFFFSSVGFVVLFGWMVDNSLRHYTDETLGQTFRPIDYSVIVKISRL